MAGIASIPQHRLSFIERRRRTLHPDKRGRLATFGKLPSEGEIGKTLNPESLSFLAFKTFSSIAPRGGVRLSPRRRNFLAGRPKRLDEFLQFGANLSLFFVGRWRFLRLRINSFLLGRRRWLCICDRLPVVVFQLPDEKSSRVSQVLRSCDLDLFQHVLLAILVEAHPRVRSYVKNHNLGLEVPYRYGSETRRYVPDFIVRVDDGHGDDDLLNLIIEIKGYRREDAKEKKSTMDTYWVPGVNHLGTHGRWAFAELREVYQMRRQGPTARGSLLA